MKTHRIFKGLLTALAVFTALTVQARHSSNDIHLIDLGLSVKWADMNIDATKATDNGGYYAWGEIATKDTYTWENYFWCNGTETSCQNIGPDISKIRDYDRAYNFSSRMCLPTVEQWQELISKCTWKSATVDGVKGYNVTGPNGNTIFLPFSGCSYDGEDHNIGSSAYYWTANNESSDASKARTAYLKSGSKTKVTTIRRRTGAAIRAVGLPVAIELVDLGLSVKWASMNIDATETTEYGGFYAWGETRTKGTYTWDNYAWCNGTENSCQNIGSDISGNLKYDRAKNYSAKMCLPTAEQWQELISNCTWKSATVDGVKGCKVTGPNGNSIFLPYTGCSYDGEDHNVGSSAYYWTANNESSDASKARAAYLKSGSKTKVTTIRRRTGAAIRAVAATAPSGKQYALYNYRNDGDFNAWLNIDVDSITFSRVDTLGVEHDDVVVQEVWTPDSVYRIPLEAIDSIGFRAPEPEFKSDVFHITEEHFPYVIDTDSLSITFNSNIPFSMLPQKGQIVISDVYGIEPFESGFAGRVKKIVNNANTVKIECNEVSIDDIYNQIICVGRTIAYSSNGSQSRTKKFSINEDGTLGVELLPIQIKLKDSDAESSINLDL